MSFTNNNTYGNKGYNGPFQISMLQLLSQIAQSTTVPCCPTAATEATLQQVLAAVQGGSLFFNNLVIDQGGVGCPANCPVYAEIRIWNGVSFDPPVYYDAAGNIVVPVSLIVYINPDFHLAEIVLQLTPQARVHNTIKRTIKYGNT